MRLLWMAAVTALLASQALAQYAVTGPDPRPPGKSWASAIPPPPGGGFTMGADDCSAPHTNAGTGDVFDVPFATGSTGTDGQNESNCYAFGSTSVENDVWFDWTSTGSGIGRWTTCSGTSVDTKIAAWPDLSPGGCPIDGTSLACNDDACGFQSTVEWPITPGATYTLQLGTFPGASGGSGTFDVTVEPPVPCGQYDDGITENALGLTAGGETMWLHEFHCGSVIDEVSTAYGTPLGTAPPNGNASRIAVYQDADCDGDPTTGTTLLASLTTVVTNSATDILNANAIGPVSTASGCAFVAATADQAPGEFPGPTDHSNPVPEAWVAGNTPSPGSMDIVDLNNNNVPPLNTNAIGFPTAWLLRAHIEDEPGTRFCFGDATHGTCPCGNVPEPGAGCGNGSFPQGAALFATGTAVPDTVVLHATRATPLQPGLFFQGETLVNGGLGAHFGDGLRCTGTNVVRLEVVVADVLGQARSSVPVAAAGGVSPGDTRHYQLWYRDPMLSPCGSGFNLTNGYTLDW